MMDKQSVPAAEDRYQRLLTTFPIFSSESLSITLPLI